MDSKKKTFLILKRVAAVILSAVIVASVVPMGYAEETNVITQWQDGINYVEENSKIEADIPENAIVVVKGSTVTIDKNIKLSGSIWLADNASSVNIVGDGAINVAYPGAYVKQNYAVFAYGTIDLSEDADAQNIWGVNAGTIQPGIELSNEAELNISGNYAENVQGSKIVFLKGTATINNKFGLGANDVLVIGAQANIQKDESAAFSTSPTSKIYNKSTNSGVLSALNGANCTVYHYVTNISDDTRSAYIAAGKEYVITADKDNGYKLSSVKINGAHTQITDEYIMGITINEPCSIETAVAEVTPSKITVFLNDSEFLPGGTYAFNASVSPENAKNKNVIWYVTDAGGNAVDKNVASIDQNGSLSIGRDVANGYAIKVCAKSEADAEVIGSMSLTVSVADDANINDYLLFNGEQYANDKWYNGSVTVSISEKAKKSGYTKLAYTTENGEIKYSDDLGDSVTLTETTKNIKFKLFKDGAGALDISGSYNVLIDNTAPVVESIEVLGTNPADGTDWWKDKQEFKVIFSDSESGISAFEYREESSITAIQGGTITKNEETGKYEAIIAISADAAEEQKYFIKAYDAVGNESEERSFSVKVDNAEPSLKAYIDTQDPTLNFIEIITLGIVKINKSHNIKIEADDEKGSGIREIGYKLVEEDQNKDEIEWTVKEGNASGVVNIDNIKLDSEGVYTVLAYAEDMVGNRKEFAANTEGELLGKVMVDKTAPIITLKNGSDEEITSDNNITYINLNSNDFKIKATAEDDESAKAVSGLKDFTASFSYDGQSIGEYTFEDYNGAFNKEFSFDSATLLGLLNKDEAKYNALPDGEYVISFVAEDEAGNKTEVVKYNVISESTEPTINAYYSVADGKFAIEKELTVDVTAGCSGIKSVTVSYGEEENLKTETLEPENGKYIYNAKENAVYKFTVETNAGNKASTDFDVALIDKAAPSVLLSAHKDNASSDSYESGTWTNTGVIISLSNNIETQGIDKYFYRVKPADDTDTPWTEIVKDSDNNYTVKFTDDCITEYEFKLISENGNESTAEIEVKIDKSAPIIKEIDLPEKKGGLFNFVTKATKVTITAEEVSANNVESGVDKIEYKVYDSKDNTLILIKEATLKVDKNNQISFDLDKNFKGRIEARA